MISTKLCVGVLLMIGGSFAQGQGGENNFHEQVRGAKSAFKAVSERLHGAYDGSHLRTTSDRGGETGGDEDLQYDNLKTVVDHSLDAGEVSALFDAAERSALMDAAGFNIGSLWRKVKRSAVVSKVVNNEAVRVVVTEVLEPVVVEVERYIHRTNEQVATIFELITGFIYNALCLYDLDQAVMELINGGLANGQDLMTDLIQDDFQAIKEAFDEILEHLPVVKSGLEILGLDQFINQYVRSGSRSNTLAAINDRPIQITDGKGNTGYLSSYEQNLIQSTGGLEDLARIKKEFFSSDNEKPETINRGPCKFCHRLCSRGQHGRYRGKTWGYLPRCPKRNAAFFE
jgi:hypothetical protein